MNTLKVIFYIAAVTVFFFYCGYYLFNFVFQKVKKLLQLCHRTQRLDTPSWWWQLYEFHL